MFLVVLLTQGSLSAFHLVMFIKNYLHGMCILIRKTIVFKSKAMPYTGEVDVRSTYCTSALPGFATITIVFKNALTL